MCLIHSIENEQYVHSSKNVSCHAYRITHVQIPDGTRIPLLSIHTVKHHLLNQNRNAPLQVLIVYHTGFGKKCFATEVAPIVAKIFNLSLKTSRVPQIWKSANLLPLPKESPLNSCNQLRPISLTDIIMRLFERCVYKTELAPVISHKIGSNQFAYKKGHNSTMALIKCQHAWLKWLDKDAKCVRALFLRFQQSL